MGIRDVEKANHHQSFQVFISKKYYGIDNPQVDESLNKLRSGTNELAKYIQKGRYIRNFLLVKNPGQMVI
ncbi:MAG: hypothetical protein Ct9H90mP13_00820 [Pseudomonadota bacterium]|nr:MAG: hypothetical protein Ct9H90mP13_00820 [Pseudomonadota bacterium]